MKITENEVDKIAHLARLKYEGSEKEEVRKDLDRILEWMDKLNELDTENVEPQIFMTREENIMREDVSKNTLSHEEALENAPQKDSNYFRVPKTIE